MANPNPQKYGDSSTWIYAPYSYGLTSTLANTLNAAKPKVNDYQSDSSNVWDSSLYRSIQQDVMTLNEFIDDTICPCGQDPIVSPFSKLVVINEDDSFSVESSHIRTIERNEVINWFFADRVSQTSSSQGYTYRAAYSSGSSTDTFDNQQFAPKAKALDTSNINFQVCPYTYYGLKTFVMRIQVRCFAKDDTRSPSTYSTWRTLDTWKDTYSDTEDIIGLRFRLMACNQISSTTLALTYDSSGSISTGRANMLCVTNPITVANNGVDTDTQILTLFTQGGNERCAYIFDCTQNVYNYGDYRRERVVLPCYNYFDGQTLNRYKPSSDPVAQFYYRIPYSDDTYNKILKIASLFGCYFTPTNTVTFSYAMTDNDLYLSVIGDDGIARGEFTRGSDNANNPLSGKNSIRDIDYDPTKPPTPVDHNTYSGTTGFNSLSGGASATQRYVLNDSNVRQLLTDLWTITHTIADVDYEKFDYKILDSFLVTDPINSIVSLKRFPFDIPHTFSPSKTNVCLGKNEGAAQGYLTYNVFNSVSFSGVSIYPKFGKSFLDFAPYTEYELYVPFCGTVKLNAGEILDHTLSVRMTIDLISGVCVAYILSDELCIETVTGAVSSDMQISGIDSATADSAVQNAVINHLSARTNKEVSMLSPVTPGGLMSTVMNPVKTAGAIESADTALSKANYDITHINTPIHSMGSAGGLSSWIQEFNCRLIIYYPEGEAIDSSGGVSSTSPKLADLTAYAHNTGFACVMNGTVSQFHGLTVGDIDTSSIQGASEEERSMIKTLFNQGVWLP